MNLKQLRFFSFLAVIILATSCQGNRPDVYETKSGRFASKEGRFSAAFPDRPKVLKQKNELSGKKFNVYNFIADEGQSKRYLVSYIDYPDSVLRYWDNKYKMFDQMLKGKSNLSNQFFVQQKERIDTGNVKGLRFILGSSVYKNGYGEGKLLLKDNRVYFIFFIGTDDIPAKKQIEAFIKSFRIIDETG